MVLENEEQQRPGEKGKYAQVNHGNKYEIHEVSTTDHHRLRQYNQGQDFYQSVDHEGDSPLTRWCKSGSAPKFSSSDPKFNGSALRCNGSELVQLGCYTR
jgi:Rps23 Pro-64 3,4-dihydroxylase Tpa1-like proline 4-hydroxylase